MRADIIQENNLTHTK